MPAVASSPILAVLEKLGPLDADRIADLRPYLESVPDPRSRRGRWYSLTAILLVCACAAVCGAKSIDELAEFGERATNSLLASLGIRRHLLGWRRSPKPVTIGRVLQALDGDALDQAVGACLADRHRVTAPADVPEARSRQAIAVDGKALKGSARLTAPRRHLLSAVTHDRVATIVQVEVGAKTNEVRHFQPLLAPLDLAGTVVTFDALHSVKANITWPVETKKAHYIAVIKTSRPTAYAQLAALPWTSTKVQHTASTTAHGNRRRTSSPFHKVTLLVGSPQGTESTSLVHRRAHGRRESRSVKTCAIADNLGGIAFPHAHLAIRVHRRRKPTGRPETRENVYAVTSPAAHQTRPADLAAAIREHWGIENSSHHIRDVTFAEDASTIHVGTAPRAMATIRNLAIGALKILGADNIAKTTRAIRHEPERALAVLGITNNQDTHGT